MSDWTGRPSFDPPRPVVSVAEMRAEIARMRHDHITVKAVMDVADYTGLSSEDRYTLLAYYSLVALAQAQKALYEHVLMTPGDGTFLTDRKPS